MNKRYISAFLLILFFIIGPASSFAGTSDDEAYQEHANFMASIIAKGQKVEDSDFDKLRALYASSRYHVGHTSSLNSVEKIMLTTPPEEMGSLILQHMGNIEFHMASKKIAEKSGFKETSMINQVFSEGLFNSLTSSGGGHTKKNAMIPITDFELKLALTAMINNGYSAEETKVFAEENGKTYFIVALKNTKSKKIKKGYFDISVFFKDLQRAGYYTKLLSDGSYITPHHKD